MHHSEIFEENKNINNCCAYRKILENFYEELKKKYCVS